MEKARARIASRQARGADPAALDRVEAVGSGMTLHDNARSRGLRLAERIGTAPALGAAAQIGPARGLRDFDRLEGTAWT